RRGGKSRERPDLPRRADPGPWLQPLRRHCPGVAQAALQPTLLATVVRQGIETQDRERAREGTRALRVPAEAPSAPRQRQRTTPRPPTRARSPLLQAAQYLA